MPLIGVDQQDPQRRPGIRPELGLHPRQGVGGEVEGVGVVGVRLRDPVGDRHAAGGLVLAHREVAEGHGHEVGRRAAVEVPGRDGVAVHVLAAGQLPVGHAHEWRRRGQREVVERLVGGLVVDGVPGVGAEGLLHRPGLAARCHREAAGAEVASGGRRLDRLGGAGVVHGQHVALVGGEVTADDEVLAVVGEVGVRVVDLHRRDLQLRLEVELHVVGVAGGAEDQLLDPVERPGRPGPR